MVAGRIVPPAPEKSAMGAMGVKLSKEDQTSQVSLTNSKSVSRRLLNRFLNFFVALEFLHSFVNGTLFLFSNWMWSRLAKSTLWKSVEKGGK